MKRLILPVLLIPILLIASACQGTVSACPTPVGTKQYLTGDAQSQPYPVLDAAATPIPVQMGRKTILVDRVITGALCNDHWSGIVYVACDVQVYPWTEQPTFLKDCDLQIEPGTVVYSAYHNNAAYYNGCSCHTGDIGTPQSK